MNIRLFYYSLFFMPLMIQVASSQDYALDEIVVTAEKREQSLQDVPMAIEALGSEQIEQVGYEDIGDLQFTVPSMVVGGDGKSRRFIFIRGVGTRKFDAGAEGSVGVFVDEVYNTRFSTALQGIVDLERIEVLKGPQGTLYGRNTIGGAISLVTKKPSQEFEGRVTLSAGDEGFAKFGGYVSGGLSENWAARLSLSSRTDDGNMTERLSGKDDGIDSTAIRLSLFGTPSDDLEISFTGQITSFEQDAKLAQPNLECGPLINDRGNPSYMAVAAGALAGTPAAQGFAAAGLSATTCYALGHPLPLGPTGYNQLAANLAGSGLIQGLYTAELADPRTNSADFPGFVDNDSSQWSLRVVKDFNNFTLTSITSITESEMEEGLDFEATLRRSIDTEVFQDSEQIAQEFRLNGEVNSLTWLIGLFYLDDQVFRTDNFRTRDQSLVPLIAGAAVEGVQNNIQTVDITSTAMAAYAQATLAMGENLNFTFGARYSDDEKDYTMDMFTNAPTPFIQVNDSWAETLNYSSFDPRITIDYSLSDDQMFYLTYATGYKSGGVSYASWARADSLGGFDKEELSTVELGFKGRFADNRLQVNAALYQYDYENQQQQLIVRTATGSLAGKTYNAAESEMDGYEVDINYLLTPNLMFDLSYFGQDAEFDEFTIPGLDYSGNKMNMAPDSSYLVGLSYQNENLSLRAEYSWKDDYFFDPSNRYVSKQEDKGIVNLTAIWDINDNQSIRAFCNNCSDELYKTQVTTFAMFFGGGGRSIYAPGRRMGVGYTFNF